MNRLGIGFVCVVLWMPVVAYEEGNRASLQQEVAQLQAKENQVIAYFDNKVV